MSVRQALYLVAAIFAFTGVLFAAGIADIYSQRCLDDAWRAFEVSGYTGYLGLPKAPSCGILYDNGQHTAWAECAGVAYKCPA